MLAKRLETQITLKNTLGRNYAFNFGMLFVADYTGHKDYTEFMREQFFLRE